MKRIDWASTALFAWSFLTAAIAPCILSCVISSDHRPGGIVEIALSLWR